MVSRKPGTDFKRESISFFPWAVKCSVFPKDLNDCHSHLRRSHSHRVIIIDFMNVTICAYINPSYHEILTSLITYTHTHDFSNKSRMWSIRVTAVKPQTNLSETAQSLREKRSLDYQMDTERPKDAYFWYTQHNAIEVFPINCGGVVLYCARPLTWPPRMAFIQLSPKPPDGSITLGI